MQELEQLTITVTLSGEQSRALGRACRFYLNNKGSRRSDRPIIMAIAEKMMVAIEEGKQLFLQDVEKENHL